MRGKKLKLEKMTTHHRKPKSLGGRGGCRNKSRVKWKYHDAWNTLFENGTPERIAEILNETLLNLNKLKKNRRRAFFSLFGINTTIQGIMDIINKTWLDPDYELKLDANDKFVTVKKK